MSGVLKAYLASIAQGGSNPVSAFLGAKGAAEDRTARAQSAQDKKDYQKQMIDLSKQRIDAMGRGNVATYEANRLRAQALDPDQIKLREDARQGSRTNAHLEQRSPEFYGITSQPVQKELAGPPDSSGNFPKQVGSPTVEDIRARIPLTLSRAAGNRKVEERLKTRAKEAEKTAAMAERVRKGAHPSIAIYERKKTELSRDQELRHRETRAQLDQDQEYPGAPKVTKPGLLAPIDQLLNPPQPPAMSTKRPPIPLGRTGHMLDPEVFDHLLSNPKNAAIFLQSLDRETLNSLHPYLVESSNSSTLPVELTPLLEQLYPSQ